jgi:hypothetical protein
MYKRRPKGAGPLPVVTVRISHAAYEIAEKKAHQLKITRGQYLREIIEKALKR